jgi:hypothetical protein
MAGISAELGHVIVQTRSLSHRVWSYCSEWTYREGGFLLIRRMNDLSWEPHG